MDTEVPTEMFGSSLAPALYQACEGRLGAIQWFRTDWQRGGALTGYASWTQDGQTQAVVVKLPISPNELTWFQRLSGGDYAVVPLLLAGGRELGGYDLAWAVMERMRYGPLDGTWNGREIPLLLDAAARFFAATRPYPLDQPPRQEPWPANAQRSRQALKDLSLSNVQRWTQALRTLQKKMTGLLKTWNDRPITDWCHGDLHLGNAMTQAPPPDGPAVLFDLPAVHSGHWVEDAIYLESLFWSHPQRLAGLDIPRSLTAARRQYGLKGDAGWPRLANIRRAFWASATPAQQTSRPDPAQLDAALNVLELALSHLT